MADLDISDPTGVKDKRRGRGTTSTQPMAEINNTQSISQLKTRLAALNGTSYSATRLATMTKNDMLYALRIASADSAGI